MSYWHGLLWDMRPFNILPKNVQGWHRGFKRNSADLSRIRMADLCNNQVALLDSIYKTQKLLHFIVLSCLCLMSRWNIFGTPSNFLLPTICWRSVQILQYQQGMMHGNSWIAQSIIPEMMLPLWSTITDWRGLDAEAHSTWHYVRSITSSTYIRNVLVLCLINLLKSGLRRELPNNKVVSNKNSRGPWNRLFNGNIIRMDLAECNIRRARQTPENKFPMEDFEK